MAKNNRAITSTRRNAPKQDNVNYADLGNPEWLLPKLPSGFWKEPRNHTRYVFWLSKQLNIKKLDDWYQVSKADVVQHYGGGLLKYYYNDSLIELVQAHYQQRRWYPWLFKYTPGKYWEKRSNRIDYLTLIGEKLGYRAPEDWYQVNDLQCSHNSHHPKELTLTRNLQLSKCKNAKSA